MNFFAPIGSHVSENEKKMRKNLKSENFEKKKKNKTSGGMVDRKPSIKFGLDTCSGF